MILGILLLLTGLTISAVAIYYSVLGLAAIFAAATIPIYVMGGTLEVAKLVAASWLKANWHRVTGIIKWYMSTAVLILMIITSMGIFGFLSKAHLDQSVPTGDVAAQVAIIDEKIKTQRDNIEASRAALTQMDAQVNQRLSGSNADQSAERSVQIRRQQAGERAKLQKEIGDAQREIAKLNEQRAPVASQLRKVEAEVGPIKYIAQFIYGQEADQNLLEKAVTWVIILIVIVFDPLALAMLLAAQMTFGWFREEKKKAEDDSLKVKEDTIVVNPTVTDIPATEPEKPVVTPEEKEVMMSIFTGPVPHHPDTHPYLNQGFRFPEGFERVKPLVANDKIEQKLPEFEDSQFPEIIVDTPEIKIDKEPLAEWTDKDFEEIAVETFKDIEREESKEETVLTADNAVATISDPVHQELPAEEQASKKKIHDQESGQADSNEQEMTYVQNSEQSESSLWKKLRERVTDEFRPKDYLIVVYNKGAFEDFQYDAEQDPELDKFIKHIKNNTHSFGDYPQEELKTYASRIYELRKD